MQLCRAVIDALLPGGSLWTVLPGGGLDQLWDGIAACMESVRTDLAALARVRYAKYTPVLPDLEREYGLVASPGASEAQRRGYLAAVQAAGQGDGSAGYLQAVLRAAGFDVQVHTNNPAVDPGFFLFYAPSAIVGNETAVVGAAQVGGLRGELLVNGQVWNQQELVRYVVPVPPQYWPLVFFIGGNATRNDAGELTDIEPAEVPVSRRAEFINLILRTRPLHSWAGLMLQYT